ncbi:MAG: glycosyltransferase family 39 protein [Dehalococcoidia bacterium]|nr:glycosyltransferase family 39 protein [Dehalococcoidia bacterium]
MLLLILGLALGLRLYGIGWDSFHGYHPDERSIYMRADCMYDVLTQAPGYEHGSCYRDNPGMEAGVPSPGTFVDAERSPLNPHWFPLGSVLIYLLVLFRGILEPFGDFGTLENMSYVGRTLGALADVGSVYMVFLLGRRIFSPGAGLLAAGLTALAVVHIQISHFYRPEPLLVFFLLASFWAMLRVMDLGRIRDSLLLGAFVGLTVSTKVSVLPLAFPLVLAYAFTIHGVLRSAPGVSLAYALRQVMPKAIAGAAMSLVVFFLVTPYALLDISNFVGDQVWQARNVARTAGIVPFTLQYVGESPLLYEIRQTVVWGLGVPLGIVAWGGLLFTMVKVLRGRGRHKGEVLLLAWAVPSIILLAFFETKFLRYIFPVVPFLVLMGSGMLFSALAWAQKYRDGPSEKGGDPELLPSGSIASVLKPRLPGIVAAGIVLLVAPTAFYALAFESIYSKPHTAVQASDWINENVPQGSAILTDNHWDEPIRNLGRYDVEQIVSYERDSVDKMDVLAGQLASSDYLVFYSSRTYGSIARLPERYPMTSNYYRHLFSGNLGYDLERSFTSYPELFGVAFVDDTYSRANLPEPEAPLHDDAVLVSLDLGYADENVINYDHPKVLLFRNQARMTFNELFPLLVVVEDPPPGLMLSPEQQVAQQSGGTFSEIIPKSSWTNRMPVLAWFLLVEVIFLAALPLATFIFRPLPDRGIVFARLLGILGVSYVAWMLASTGWMGFSRMSVLVGILSVGAVSCLVLAFRWREFICFIRSNIRLLLVAEVLFLAAFLAFVVLKAANPDLWHFYRGGEKPMDFAYLNAVLRSTTMPPYDPWYSGGYLNYYYYGQFIVATLIRATGILPSVAYNLAIPLLFALTVTGAYSLVFNVAAGLRRLKAGDAPGVDGAEASDRWGNRVPWGPVGAGLFAALFVGVIGNLDGIAQVVKGAWEFLFTGAAFPTLEYLSDFWRSSRMIPSLPEVTPNLRFLTFWLPDLGDSWSISSHITEFPYFTFLFADLHAHLVAIPFTLLALGVALSLAVGLKRAGPGWIAGAVLVLGGTVGSLWAINSWDYPTYLLLSVALIGVGVLMRDGTPGRKVWLFLALAVATGLLSYLLFLPFHASYHPYPLGFEVSRWQTPLLNFMGVHGLFVLLVVALLAYVQRDALRAIPGRIVSLGTVWRSFRLPGLCWPEKPPWMGLAGAVGLLIAAYLAAAQYWTSAFLVMLLVALALTAVKLTRKSEGGNAFMAFIVALVAMALLVALGVEFVRVQDDIGRMNTQFKFYVQVWVLLALGSACILWFLKERGVFRMGRMGIVRGGFLAVLALLVVSSFFYTVLGTRDRLADRFDTGSFTLDGARYMTTTSHNDRTTGALIEHNWDYQAIEWLQDNVQGSPVVLEAHTDQYHWGARIANYTGLPTVLGWPWHQTQQRMKYADSIQERRRDVRTMYATQDVDEAMGLLEKYRVSYIVVGQLERSYYPAEGLEKFDDLVASGKAEVVYENEGTRIYGALWYNRHVQSGGPP